MKKSKKIDLGYFLGLCLLIWPKFSEVILSFLRRFNVVNQLPNDTLRDYVGVSLLRLTALILVIIILRPTQLSDVLLATDKIGSLSPQP
jgi:hypothetical protein